ncbi:N-acetylglucosamine-6-phosphate deacetylase [Terrarubrum flagellatum]|uniref:N-acetylglucosamine-6-phosphate deacetylase n=1 Tax=Terrirubrum flagellatum TaxID=2895980 RepID=UPI0031450B47
MLVGRDPATGQPVEISVANGRIAAIEPSGHDIDHFISPGLIDLQVNGYDGHDLNDGALAPETVIALAAAMRRVGVTTFLPTLITASEERIVAALRAIAEARRADETTARMIPFVHVEGPFLSAEDGPRGAHPREWVRAPDLAEVERWRVVGEGLVGLVTLSPHFDEAPDFISALVARGIRVSIGHTHASADQIRAAAAVGASLSTHLGNGAAANLPRHPNFIWAQLAEDRLTATFIADGHHLPADAFTAMLRAKSLDRAILVSDVTALGGKPSGIYEQAIGGRVELSADGRLGIPGTPYLAGAARSLKDNVAIAARMAGLSLADALRLAATNPGKIIGGRGAFAIGAPADLIMFRWSPGDETLDIQSVFVGGREID